ERRHVWRRAFDRGAGNRGASAVHAQTARHASRSRGGGDRGDHGSAARRARDGRSPVIAGAIPSLGWGEDLARLLLAAALGGAIGFERELRDREAGLRTHLLVCLGSALFTIVSAYGFRDFLTSGDQVIRADPTRIAAQIVTGIGFLGSGVIIRQGLTVRGLTTAATLWVAAAIGIAAGAGYYSGAVLA